MASPAVSHLTAWPTEALSSYRSLVALEAVRVIWAVVAVVGARCFWHQIAASILPLAVRFVRVGGPGGHRVEEVVGARFVWLPLPFLVMAPLMYKL